ncbi:hypothetical protein HDR61_05275 [bacterium]|nr:hypothetical protein [Bacteroidales bacterium]MBD5401119.1 hypothetical protein [bacterium]
MADNQGIKSKRELFSERLRERYPDKDFSDEEALFGQISDDYDQSEQKVKGFEDREQALTGMFSKYPHAARFISDMAAGVNPWVAMVEQIGMDGITDMFKNPRYKEELAKAQEAYIERLAKEDDLEKEYKKNLGGSLKELQQLQEERGLSDEEIDSAVDLLMEIANNAIMGKFNRESLEMALKALHHDSAVENARAEGKIEGKNERAVETLRKPKRGDGLPRIGGNNNSVRSPQAMNSIFSIAEQARTR